MIFYLFNRPLRQQPSVTKQLSLSEVLLYRYHEEPSRGLTLLILQKHLEMDVCDDLDQPASGVIRYLILNYLLRFTFKYFKLLPPRDKSR